MALTFSTKLQILGSPGQLVASERRLTVGPKNIWHHKFSPILITEFQ